MKSSLFTVLIVFLGISTGLNLRIKRQDSIIFPKETATRIVKKCSSKSSCVLLSSCRSLLPVLKNPSAQDLIEIRALLCDYSLNEPMVCCSDSSPPKPAPAQPPKGPAGGIPNPPPNQGEPFNPELHQPDGGLSIVDGLQVDQLPKTCGIGKDGFWPWMALVGDRDRKGWFCGGSLITSRHVLTAAHCVDGTALRFQVRLGSSSIEDNTEETIFRVLRVVPHPAYKRETNIVTNDIALLVLDQTVDFTDQISPICLRTIAKPDQSGDAEILSHTVGFGIQFFGNPKSKTPVRSTISTRPFQECIPSRINEVTYLCSIQKDVTCQADGGGALFDEENGKFYQKGIVSFTSPCDNASLPMLYTRVAHYERWIKQNLV